MAEPSSSPAAAQQPLTDAMVRDSLSLLGRHPLTGAHVFLACKCPRQGLTDLSALAQFPHVMYVNVAGNAVEDLAPLAALPGLVELDVSDNALTSCLDFCPPHCTATHAWSTGHKAVGSMLTVANAAGNRIADMGEARTGLAARHPFLECLVLRGNRIERVTGLAGLRFLQVLDLSRNRLRRIEGLDGLPLVELNVAGNHLTELSGLQQLPRLSVLNVAHNYVRSLGPLGDCSQLHHVDARGNLVEHVRQTEFLADLQWLHHVLLTGNPCCAKPYYRLRAAFRLQTLQTLDGVTVTSEEKIRANNLYGSSEGDLQYREDVFARHFPDEPFQHFMPFFEDEEMALDSEKLMVHGADEVYVPEEVKVVASSIVESVMSRVQVA